MDEMGIDTAVLFGGHCFLVASIVESPAIAAATLCAYNDYLAGYCAVAPDRLKGVAMGVGLFRTELLFMGVSHVQVRFRSRDLAEHLDQMAAFGAAVLPLVSR